jgi:hypothetical protein
MFTECLFAKYQLRVTATLRKCIDIIRYKKKHISNVQSLSKSIHTCVKQQTALRTNGLPNSDLSDFTYIAKCVSSPLSQPGLGWPPWSKLTEGSHTTGHVIENGCLTTCQLLRLRGISNTWLNEQEALVERYWQGTTEAPGNKPVPVSLCSPKIPQGLAWNRTRSFTVKGRQAGDYQSQSQSVTQR